MNDQSGYTLLFAVLTATLVLGVAVFILSISRGQYMLASTARESTYAIYAADSGIECSENAIVNVVSSTTGKTSDGSSTFGCFKSENVSTEHVDSPSLPDGYDSNYYDSINQFVTDIELGDDRCAVVTFTTAAATDGTPVTVVESRGYNFCDGPTPDIDNPRIVERAIRKTYDGIWMY